MNEINNDIKKFEDEKSKLPPCAETNEDKMNIIDRCCKNFQNLIENKNLYNNKSIALQLDEKFEEFKSEFHKDINIFLDKKYVERVSEAVKNSSEIYLKNFQNLDCVHQFIHEQIEDYFSYKCQNFIEEIEIFMLQNLKNYIAEAFKGYEYLKNYIINIYDEKIIEQKNFLNDFFSKISKIEKENIYTINPNYMKSINKVMNNIDIPFIDNQSESLSLNSNNNQNQTLFGNNQNRTVFGNSNNNNSIFGNSNNNQSQNFFGNSNNNQNNLFNNDNNKFINDSILKENVKKVIVSIFVYCNVFENRFLDYFFQCIIHIFLNYFTQEPTAIIRKNVNISLLNENPDIKIKRDSFNNSLKSLNDAKKKLIKLF